MRNDKMNSAGNYVSTDFVDAIQAGGSTDSWVGGFLHFLVSMADPIPCVSPCVGCVDLRSAKDIF